MWTGGQLKKIVKPFVLLGKSLLAAYIVTGILLLLLAMFLFHFYPDDRIASTGIVVIYSVACLLGGFISGKQFKKRKWLWGMITGKMYFLCITLVAFFQNSTMNESQSHGLKPLFLCTVSALIGALLA